MALLRTTSQSTAVHILRQVACTELDQWISLLVVDWKVSEHIVEHILDWQLRDQKPWDVLFMQEGGKWFFLLFSSLFFLLCNLCKVQVDVNNMGSKWQNSRPIWSYPQQGRSFTSGGVCIRGTLLVVEESTTTHCTDACDLAQYSSS